MPWPAMRSIPALWKDTLLPRGSKFSGKYFNSAVHPEEGALHKPSDRRIYGQTIGLVLALSWAAMSESPSE
jgi:hypothetical protein